MCRCFVNLVFDNGNFFAEHSYFLKSALLDKPVMLFVSALRYAVIYGQEAYNLSQLSTPRFLDIKSVGTKIIDPQLATVTVDFKKRKASCKGVPYGSFYFCTKICIKRPIIGYKVKCFPYLLALLLYGYSRCPCVCKHKISTEYAVCRTIDYRRTYRR